VLTWEKDLAPPRIAREDESGPALAGNQILEAKPSSRGNSGGGGRDLESRGPHGLGKDGKRGGNPAKKVTARGLDVGGEGRRVLQQRIIIFLRKRENTKMTKRVTEEPVYFEGTSSHKKKE